MRSTPLALLVVLAACSGTADPGDPGDPGDPSDPSETNERFVGEWMVDQPLHATYEATWYEFHADGELEHLRDCALGGQVPTGFVSDASGSVRCEFADRWSAPDADTLAVRGSCSDSRDREIVLGFPTDATGNATGQPAIEVVSVAGEAGWGHFTFDWQWQHCGDQSCAPQISTCQ